MKKIDPSKNTSSFLNSDIFNKKNSTGKSKSDQVIDTINKIKKIYEANYIYNKFCVWFIDYITAKPHVINNYFSGDKNLNIICQDFVNFCFLRNISLDSIETLTSLQEHDRLADKAIKKEIIQIPPVESINLMGFGLGNGHYEKSLSNYMIEKKIARKVNLFGFDPYAIENDEIKLITEDEFFHNTAEKFDIIIARWVLHHVDYKYRWKYFVNCVKSMNKCGMVLIIEHGFLKDNESRYSCVTPELYALVNACFDVVVNIGIRPQWFTSTPEIGSNFFIDYLTPQDFKIIRRNATCILNEKIQHLGPDFPNQTLCCFGT